MRWALSHRFDSSALPLADAHYNRRKPGTPQFAPPARLLVLLTEDAGALWVTTWPYPEFTKHEWAGAWVNSSFRREAGPLASELIAEAVACTRWKWPEVPELGMVTFVNASKVKHKRDPGRCYVKAGFTRLKKRTKGGLIVLQMKPEDMPPPATPLNANLDLFGAA